MRSMLDDQRVRRLVLCGFAAASALGVIAAAAGAAASATTRFTVSESRRYVVPEVEMVTSGGGTTSLRAVVDPDKAIFLNFIFTSCQAICPVMSGTFSQVQRRLGPELGRVRLVSVSIDPETDTPEVLREYAERFHAGPAWTLLTGTRENVSAVQHGFDNYQRNKMDHAAVVFMRRAHSAEWVRIEGFPSAAELVDEYHKLTGH